MCFLFCYQLLRSEKKSSSVAVFVLNGKHPRRVEAFRTKLCSTCRPAAISDLRAERVNSAVITSHRQGQARVLLRISDADLLFPSCAGGTGAPRRGIERGPPLPGEALMSRRLLRHERLGGLIPRAPPLLPLSSRCVPPSSPLAEDNRQPALLPKRVVRGPRQPGSEGGPPVIGHAEPRHKRTAGCSPRPGGCRCQSQRQRRTVGRSRSVYVRRQYYW